jgi:serine/threonine-protein kinase RsbW
MLKSILTLQELRRMCSFTHQLHVQNNTKYLNHVREMLSAQIRRTSLSRTDGNQVILAVDEAITNIMEHGYDQKNEGWIDIDVKASPEKLRVLIEDSGKQFNPNKMEDPDVLQHVEEGKKRGLGIFLMRQIMDEVRYRFKEGNRNEICLVKYVKGKDPQPEESQDG